MKVGIVGGGPAGSRAAELLVRQGARVVLYEARVRWEKPCGGGVPERGIDSCPFLRDPDLPQSLATRARIYSGSGREAVVSLSEPLRIFSRRELNHRLLERAETAGTDVRRVRVAGLVQEGSKWRVRDGSGTTESFDYVVGADGASGMLRGRLPEAPPPLGQNLGLGYYLDGYTCEEIILKFFPRLDGYLWVFPRTDHLAAGICGPTGAGRGEELRKELERFLLDLFGARILRCMRPYGARIPSLPPGASAGAHCQGEGWALVGDAAGFVDPLTREGIYYALESSRLLAESLARGDPAAYPLRCEESFGRELDWAARHSDFFFSRTFVEAFTLLTAASPAVQSVVSELFAGRQPYASLRRRLTGHAPAAAVSLVRSLLARIFPGRPPLPPPRLTPLAG